MEDPQTQHLVQNQQAQKQNQDDFEDTGKFTCYENTISCCGSIAGCLGIWLPFPCCCCPKPFVNIKQSFVGLLEKFGRYQKTLSAGLHQINPYCESIKIVNTKTDVLNLKRQTIMTNDNIQVLIDSVIFYRIFDAKKALYKLSDLKTSLEELAYTCLRTICGEHSFQDLLTKRNKINDEIEDFIEQQATQWGIYVEQIFIKDMILSSELMTQLSLVPISIKKAETKIISSQADVESAKLFREAADMLSTNAAMQIRYFELIQQMAEHKSKSVVFLQLKQNENN